MDNKHHIAVLMGGPSYEHDISLLSGNAVIENIDRNKYRVTPIIITHKNTWIFYVDPHINSVIPFNKTICRKLYEESPLADALQHLICLNVDCVFNAMHGTYGEDGTIQGMLDTIGIPYTGSPILPSSIAMDKIAYKYMLNGAGIPTATWDTIHITPNKKLNASIENILNTIGLPCVLKTPASGSSIGVDICNSTSDLTNTAHTMLKQSNRLLVEQFLSGREFTCAILGNALEKNIVALPPTEIISKNTYFDFEAKYSPDKAEEITPAPIGKSLTSYIQQTALKIHNILGCKCVSRTDFILHNEQLFVLETNTLPGLTANSLLPKSASTAGITMPKLIDMIIQFTLPV